MEKTKWGILLGGILALWACAWILWYAVPDGDWVALALTGLFLIGTLVSVYGMWRYQRWALMLSRVLAGVAFLFGCYVAQFAWTFWLFQEPTLQDRMLAVLRPQVSLFLIVPVLWVVFSLFQGIKAKFQSSK